MSDYTTSPDKSTVPMEPFKIITVEGDGDLVDYCLYRSGDIPPLDWRMVKLRVPKQMRPELALYLGMMAHTGTESKEDKPMLALAQAMHELETYKHEYRWYNCGSHQKLYAVHQGGDLWLLQELFSRYGDDDILGPLCARQLQNISRLVPEWACYDQYDVKQREAGLLQEATVPHAAALDFLHQWGQNPDPNLAPRFIPGTEPEPEEPGIPCAMISSSGDMTMSRPRLKLPQYYALLYLYNKANGYIEGSIWFQGDQVRVEGVAGEHACFEYPDPECTAKAIKYISTKLPRSADCTRREGMSQEQLAELARDMIAQRVFFSTQLGDPNLLPSVFMTLMFMGRETLLFYADHDLEIFYEYYDRAGPRSINGYPMFTSHRTISTRDYDKLIGIYERMQQALEDVVEGKV